MAPIFCPVKSCSSATGDNGCKFHRFPSDPALRETWVAFVRRGRGGDWTPTKRSLLCSRHFTPDAYTCSIQLMADFGLSTKNVRLKSDAVPTLCHPAVTARHDAIQGRGKRDCRGNNLKRVGDPEVRAPAEVSATTCRDAEQHDTEASIKKRLRRDPKVRIDYWPRCTRRAYLCSTVSLCLISLAGLLPPLLGTNRRF